MYYTRQDNYFLVVAVFVDDFFILSNSDSLKTKFKNDLKKLFTVKDLGPVKDCLGMRVSQSKGRVTLDQSHYIDKLLGKYNMTDAITVTTPMEPGLKLTLPTQVEEIDVPYRELIGSLMYIAIGTRPDIEHTVSYLSQFNTHYGGVHWKAAKRVLRYLKGTKDMRLTYTHNGYNNVVGYSDADFGNSVIDRRSYTGYVFLVSGGPISWEAHKQRTVALSTTEAEYMALAEACKEAIYLKTLIQ
ncbi:uncharacterized protein LOC133530075 [Cydia pomonella]|uniref:uncharacterized protein LOC133530075 n=1 Tax=Cydia pomonella TaxID=82600 RepID=UPI002ADD4BD3|nr:uncharacterized protein LOC133530075 [Cydia pomonella]